MDNFAYLILSGKSFTLGFSGKNFTITARDSVSDLAQRGLSAEDSVTEAKLRGALELVETIFHASRTTSFFSSKNGYSICATSEGKEILCRNNPCLFVPMTGLYESRLLVSEAEDILQKTLVALGLGKDEKYVSYSLFRDSIPEMSFPVYGELFRKTLRGFQSGFG